MLKLDIVDGEWLIRNAANGALMADYPDRATADRSARRYSSNGEFQLYQFSLSEGGVGAWSLHSTYRWGCIVTKVKAVSA